MKYLFGLVLFLVISFESNAQLQSISLEGLGSGPMYSLQYESRFGDRTKGHGYRVGLSGIFYDNQWFASIPLGYNFLFTRNERQFVELGVGLTIYGTTKGFAYGVFKNEGNAFGNLQVGYRSTIKDTNFYWRAVWSPILSDSYNRWLYGGVSFGYQWIR